MSNEVVSQTVAGSALVTGATSGIGSAIARNLADRGVPLLLVARDSDRLEDEARELHELGSPSVEVLAADLADPADVALVSERAGEVEVLVNAAGVDTRLPFPHEDLDRELMTLNVNVRAVLVLSHAAARGMQTRGSGRILNVGSTAAVWSEGTYPAGKAWVHTATSGLRSALADSGVSVTLLIPGFTRTEFHRRSETDATGVASWLWLTPDRVARDGVQAMLDGTPTCIPGRRYHALVAAARMLGPGGRRRLLRAIAPLAPAADGPGH